MIEECLVAEFTVEGDDCPLAEATRAAGATADASPPLLRSDGNALVRASTPVDDVDDLADALDVDDRVRYLHVARDGDRGTLRWLSKHPCVVHELASAGLMVESLRYRDGSAVVEGAVVGQAVLQGVMEAAGETVGVTLDRVFPLGGSEPSTVAARWDLTPAQAEAVRVAHEMGYFDVPRRATAAEVAGVLGVGKSAFVERLRRALDNLLGGVLGR